MNRRIRAAILATLAAGPDLHAGPASEPAELVFPNGTSGYHTFRIPAVVRSSGGTLLAFAEGRVKNAGDAGDIDLVLKRSTDGGRTWLPLQRIWDDAENSCSNPCAVALANGEVILVAVWKPGAINEKALLTSNGELRPIPYIMRTSDNGASWSKPEIISSAAGPENWRWYAAGPGIGIELKHGPHAGRIVIPANHSELIDGVSHYDAHTIYSDDHGLTWKLGATAIGKGANESAVAELTDGSLLFNTRMQTDGQGRRGEAVSHDGGVTWENFHTDGPLACPVCQASLLTLDDGRLLFCNPQGGGRKDLTLQLSDDDGKTWPRKALLAPGPSYGYSSITSLGPGDIGVLFEGPPGEGSGIRWKAVSLTVLQAR